MSLSIKMEQLIIFVINVKQIQLKMQTQVIIIIFYFFISVNFLGLADMSRCKTCTAYNVCTECETAGILRNDLAGCVAQCSEDTSSGLGATKVPSYHTATL